MLELRGVVCSSLLCVPNSPLDPPVLPVPLGPLSPHSSWSPRIASPCYHLIYAPIGPCHEGGVHPAFAHMRSLPVSRKGIKRPRRQSKNNIIWHICHTFLSLY